MVKVFRSLGVICGWVAIIFGSQEKHVNPVAALFCASWLCWVAADIIRNIQEKRKS